MCARPPEAASARLRVRMPRDPALAPAVWRSLRAQSTPGRAPAHRSALGPREERRRVRLATLSALVPIEATPVSLTRRADEGGAVVPVGGLLQLAVLEGMVVGSPVRHHEP